jgi:two-component system, NarL family, sensor kinase
VIARTWTRRLGTQFVAARDAVSIRYMLHDTAARHGKWSLWLVLAIYAGCLIAFIADLTSSTTAAFGVFYAPLIATAVFHRDRRAVWVLTAVACGMNVVGAFFPVIATDVAELVENRALSTLALLATAAFTWHARKIQDQLIQQTSRAAAAERMKTEVLTNLSQEIRAPLYAMIGVLELVAAGSRPDQKAALGMVRSSGRRLVTTVDNLVDLTQFEDHAMPAEPFDLGQLLRRTAEARRQDAAARQIELSIDIPSGDMPSGDTPSGDIPSGDIPSAITPSAPDVMAHANPWAVRRILENKIMDSITFTAPGGRIEVSIDVERNHVSAVIVATGQWPAGAFHSATDQDVTPLSPSIMGLALSQRLARAMGARLVLSNGPGEGTTVRLRLPTASPVPAKKPI